METSSNGTVLGNSVAKMEGMRVASPVDARKVEGLSMNGGVDGKSGAENPIPPPTNPLVTALLTDMYQITMAYAYWKAGKQNDLAVFDLLHRKNPFGGEYTVFAGLEECIRFAANFRFTDSDVAYLRTILPSRCEEAFFDYLKGVDCSEVVINAIPEGSVCFPRVPLIRVQGPLLIAQLLETTFLTLVNYASLVATNAARHRRVAGKNKILLEFGLRRAQGPDGGISGSKYCYLGGFNATSNIDAGQRFGIPVRGTHSHAFVSSFMTASSCPPVFREKGEKLFLISTAFPSLSAENLLPGMDGAAKLMKRERVKQEISYGCRCLTSALFKLVTLT